MKRLNTFENHINNKCNKKFKPENDIEEFWGDDADDEFLATQVCENIEKLYTKQNVTLDQSACVNNISIIPSYNAFAKNDVFSSTLAGPSRINDCNGDDKINKLQSQFIAKEGEVAILRSQLKHTKESMDFEFSKRQKVYEEKLNVKQKDLVKFRAELEFKDLEIANLKRKISSVSKMSILDSTLNTRTQIKLNHERNVPTDKKEEIITIIEPVLNLDYPLKDIICSTIFNKPASECGGIYFKKMLENNKNNIKNSASAPKSFLNLKSSKMKRNQISSLEPIFPDISKLLQTERKNLNSFKNNEYINKITCVGIEFLNCFLKYLQKHECYLQKETIMQLDLDYLNDKQPEFKNLPSLFDSKPLCPNECGIQCRQIIAFLAEILPYNKYLQIFLLKDEAFLEFSGNEDYLFLDHLKNLKRNKLISNYLFLNLILSIVTIIGRIRIASYCSGFLSSVCQLLTRICEHNYELSDQVYKIFSQIIKEIILSRPNTLVLYYISKFFNSVSLHHAFLEYLCNMPRKTSLKENRNKGIALINPNCCMFQVFSILYRQNLNKNVIFCERHLNMLQFISNVFNSNITWLNYQHQGDKHHNCSYEFIKLSVEIIFVALEEFNENNLKDEQYSYHMKCILQISIKILNVLNFKSHQFVEEAINIRSKCNVIKQKMLQLKNKIQYRECDVYVLDRLFEYLTEDLCNLKISKVEELPLWKE